MLNCQEPVINKRGRAGTKRGEGSLIFIQGKGAGHIYLCTHFELSIKGVSEGGESHPKKYALLRGGSREFEHGLPLFASALNPLPHLNGPLSSSS